MSSRAANIIKTLYGDELRPASRKGLFARHGRRTSAAIAKRTTCPHKVYRRRRRIWTLLLPALIVAGALCFAAFASGVYFFNVLVRLEQDVFKGQARIDSLLQRRRNISTNLGRTVRDYAIHEEGVFSHVSNMRATAQGLREHEHGGAKSEAAQLPALPGRTTGVGSTSGAAAAAIKQAEKVPKDSMLEDLVSLFGGASPGALDVGRKLGGLLAVSERYPDLKLSENFRSFMDALVDTEKNLSDERITYSETVNNYTTQLKSLPGRWFARLYGFAPLPYYRADDGAKQFRPVEY